MVSTHDDTEVSTFTTDSPSREDQLLEVLNRNKANLPSEVLALLKQAGIPPQGGLGENESAKEKNVLIERLVDP